MVALFTRAWIEMINILSAEVPPTVALFTRAWIEIRKLKDFTVIAVGRPLHEGVD